MKPNSINILGREYRVIYCEKPSDVDIYGRSSLWGQVDFWTRTIRVYDNGRTEIDLLQTLLHESLHAITTDLNITEITKDSNEEEIIDLLALALADMLTRNGWIKSSE